MPYDIVEDGDYTGIKCSDCKKVIASEYNPYHGPGMKITLDIFYKLEKHSRTCRKRPRKSSSTKARK